jgi:hypothetical protein
LEPDAGMTDEELARAIAIADTLSHGPAIEIFESPPAKRRRTSMDDDGDWDFNSAASNDDMAQAVDTGAPPRSPEDPEYGPDTLERDLEEILEEYIGQGIDEDKATIIEHAAADDTAVVDKTTTEVAS